MVINSDGTGFTFIRTSGLLAPDPYTLTLVSGSNAFESTNGVCSTATATGSRATST